MRAVCIMVMGPSGVGKTTTAKAIANALNWTFAEGDEFHPASNIAKMSAGIPLDDQDRQPWLETIRDWMTQKSKEGVNTVITCSALKRRYRDILQGTEADLRFLQLDAPVQLVGERMSRRSDHYMPLSLLNSQFDALEPLQSDENGIVISVEENPEQVVSAALQALAPNI
ncbi:gluconokinase [Aureimonas fodinaquatilis]|uniref:Gluconokinase n=1 Tax=Aureimonas fodinaquatilis TaxID=2565783 RepID=A0A5B0DN86_9HYPH|nr:gluconokinase [Aureimonas fodinaquatilis]KAA0968244.1 gluconokinase [Aureimonas fodinaquatilis]